MKSHFLIFSCLHYRPLPFPTEKKNPEKRNTWKKLLNQHAFHGEGCEAKQGQLYLLETFC